MMFKTLSELPAEANCNICGVTKPISQMLVVHHRRRTKWTRVGFYVRPRCKDCHNKGQRGHRRDYKTKYLRIWRKRNRELNESYWRQRQAEHRKEISERAYLRFQKHHEAMLIQGRLRRRGFKVSLEEAKQLYKKFGRCYPTHYGLTAGGERECERIRSKQRRVPKEKRFSAIEIRMMVYEDGWYKNPRLQPLPYKRCAEQLRRWQAQRRCQAQRRAA